MFKKFFGSSKKDKPKSDIDPTNLTLNDLKRGYVLEYATETWEVKEEYAYDWGNEIFSKQFKLASQDDLVYVSLVDEDTCYVLRNVKFNKLDDDVEDAFLDGKAPREISFDGKDYFRERKLAGYFKNIAPDEDWQEYACFEYFDSTEKYVLLVEQWDDEDFEVFVGDVVSVRRFSNILPG